MTVIENDNPKISYTGPFTEGQLLPLTFPYIDKYHIKLIIDGVQKLINVDYEVITESDPDEDVAYPNSVYIKADMPKAKQATIYRETPLDQQAAFPQNSKFRSERIEQALDKICMEQQEQEEMLSRCILAPITLGTFNGQLPEPAPNQALKWNEDCDAIENYDIIGNFEAFQEEIHDDMDAYEAATDAKFNTFKTETNTTINNFKTEVNTTLTTFEGEVDDTIDAFKTTVNDNITLFKTGVNSQLSDMSDDIDACTATANSALTKATAAVSAADTANTTANSAKTIAQNAVSTAEAAQTAATAAQTAATTAQNAATTAQSAASTAQTAATTAQASATKAAEDAADALSQIEEAVTKADAAAAAAASVVGIANQAAADAESALSQIDEAVTKADAVYDIATNAQTTANAAQTAATAAASSAASAAQDAQAAAVAGWHIGFGMWATSDPGFGSMVANADQAISATTYPAFWTRLQGIYNGTITDPTMPVMSLADYEELCGTDREDLAGLCNGRCGEAVFHYIIDTTNNVFYLPIMLKSDKLIAGDYCPTVVSGETGGVAVAIDAMGCYWQHGMLFSLSPKTETRSVKKIVWRADSEMVDKSCTYHAPYSIGDDTSEIATQLVVDETITIEDQPGFSKPIYSRRFTTPLDIPFAYTLVNTNYSLALWLMEKVGTKTETDGTVTTILDDSNSRYMGQEREKDTLVTKTTESVSIQLNFYDTQSENDNGPIREEELMITADDGSKYGVVSYTLVGLTHVPPVSDYTTDKRLYIKLA